MAQVSCDRSPDDDDEYWPLDYVWALVAACLLAWRDGMTEDDLPSYDDGDERPFSEKVSEMFGDARLEAALAEVQAMTPEQRGAFMRPFLNDYDA